MAQASVLEVPETRDYLHGERANSARTSSKGHFSHVINDVVAPRGVILGVTSELPQRVAFAVHLLGVAHELAHLTMDIDLLSKRRRLVSLNLESLLSHASR